MTNEHRTTMVEDQMDLVYALCQSFAEVDEEDNCRALYEEYAEWIMAEHDENESGYEVMWAPNYSLH